MGSLAQMALVGNNELEHFDESQRPVCPSRLPRHDAVAIRLKPDPKCGQLGRPGEP